MDAALDRIVEQVQAARVAQTRLDIRGGGTKAFYGGPPSGEPLDVTPLAGIRYLPRQDMANGWISQYEIHLSDDAKQWRPVASAGTWKTDRQEKVVPIDPPQPARFVRLVAIASFEGKPFAAVAELDVVVP